MHIRWRTTLTLLITILGVVSVLAQDIVIHAVDGKNGRPLSNQHLLLFASESGNGHDQTENLYTDKSGIAIIPSGTIKYSRLQVWVDGHTKCSHDPKELSWSMEQIHLRGVTAENNCSRKIATVPQPNTLVVYARDPTFLEGMRW